MRIRVMLAVKAAPEIGLTHGETVCVAGVRIDSAEAAWIRLFPVAREWFFGKAHPKGQVFDVDVVKHEKDQRPESYRPILDSVDVVDQLDPSGRAPIYNRLPNYNTCDLVKASGWQRTSLGLVIPAEVTNVSFEPRAADEMAEKAARSAQAGLFDNRSALEFCPFYIRYDYRCRAPHCRGNHHQTIVDWEASEGWRTWRARYPTEPELQEALRAKWMQKVDASKKGKALILGNMKQAPAGFLVLGVADGVMPKPPSIPATAPPAPQPRPPDGTGVEPPRSTEGRLFD